MCPGQSSNSMSATVRSLHSSLKVSSQHQLCQRRRQERANTVRQAVYVPNDTEFLGLVESKMSSSRLYRLLSLNNMVPYCTPSLFLGFIFYYILSRLQQLNPSRSAIKNVNARIDESNHLPIRFSDVAGVDEAIEEVRELVDFLKNPQSLRDSAARSPKASSLSDHRAPERPCSLEPLPEKQMCPSSSVWFRFCRTVCGGWRLKGSRSVQKSQRTGSLYHLC